MRLSQALTVIQSETDKVEQSRPSWKHRRRLIYSAFGLGVFMILFAMGSFFWGADMSMAVPELIIGGVSLISIILSAYVAGAVAEDRALFKPPMHELPEEDPE